MLLVFALAASVIMVSERPMPAVATADIGEMQTEAVRTFIAELTASATTLPSPTRTVGPDTSPTASAAQSGTPNCLGLRFVRDVTIADNSQMTPAEVFTKTWLVENNGTCPWRPGFQVVLIGGVAMGGSPFRVAQAVGPGGQIQVSIKMVTPTNQTGVVQGTWKMSDADGALFGDYLSVVIVVRGPTRAAATAAGATTATP